ncbi:MAG: flagellar hook-length control protein FliK [Phycisphaerales bacterium]|nr:MAG: flagellar hook-length control protein FliK [Phycisphaerales bacterium]
MTANAASNHSTQDRGTTLQGGLHGLRVVRTERSLGNAETAPEEASGAVFAQLFGAQLTSHAASSQLLRIGAALGDQTDAMGERGVSPAGQGAAKHAPMTAGERAAASLTQPTEGRVIAEQAARPEVGGSRPLTAGAARAHAIDRTGEPAPPNAPARASSSLGEPSTSQTTPHGDRHGQGRQEHPSEQGQHAPASSAGGHGGAPSSPGASVWTPSVSGVVPARGAGAAPPSPGAAQAAAPNAIAATGRSEGSRPGPTVATKPGAPAPSRGQEAQLAAQVQRGLFAALRQQGGSVTMRLAPDALGALTVRLSVQGARVQATFEPTSEQAQRLLERSVETLRAALESKGLAVERITVQPAWSAGGRGAEAGQAHEQGGSGGSGSRERGLGGGGDDPSSSGSGREDPGGRAGARDAHAEGRRVRVTDDTDAPPAVGTAEAGPGGEDRGGAPQNAAPSGGAVVRLDRIV